MTDYISDDNLSNTLGEWIRNHKLLMLVLLAALWALIVWVSLANNQTNTVLDIAESDSSVVLLNK